MKIRYLSILAVLVLVIAACGNNGAAQVPAAGDAEANGLSGTITHWVWGDFEERGAYRFNDYYPDIHINFVVTPSGEFITNFQMTLAAGAQVPDILNVEIDHRAFLFALDNVFYVLDDDPFNIDRSLLVDFAIPLLTNPYDQILGVQVDNCVGGLMFRRDLALEFFGTDDVDEVEALFQTFDDFVYWAARVNEQSGGRTHMFASAGDAFRAFSSIGVGNSEPVVVDGYRINVRRLFGPTLEVMEGMIRYNGIGTLSGWSPAWFASFSGDNVIFFPGPTWFISHVVKPNYEGPEENWGLISPPGGSFSWGGTAYSIPVGALEPELAWHFISWLTLSQAGAESFFSAHATPTLYAPAYDTPLFQNNPDPFFRGQDVVAKLLEIAAHPDTRSRPISVFDTVINSAAGYVFVEMVDHGMTAAEALDFWEEHVIFLDSRLHR